MSVVEEFWLQERILRFFRLRHNVGTSELRRVAMLAGYLCPQGPITEAGRTFAQNLCAETLQRREDHRPTLPSTWTNI
jgi:hypothetical protein